jgi:hypothetical protein
MVITSGDILKRVIHESTRHRCASWCAQANEIRESLQPMYKRNIAKPYAQGFRNEILVFKCLGMITFSE